MSRRNVESKSESNPPEAEEMSDCWDSDDSDFDPAMIPVPAPSDSESDTESQKQLAEKMKIMEDFADLFHRCLVLEKENTTLKLEKRVLREEIHRLKNGPVGKQVPKGQPAEGVSKADLELLEDKVKYLETALEGEVKRSNKIFTDFIIDRMELKQKRIIINEIEGLLQTFKEKKKTASSGDIEDEEGIILELGGSDQEEDADSMEELSVISGGTGKEEPGPPQIILDAINSITPEELAELQAMEKDLFGSSEEDNNN